MMGDKTCAMEVTALKVRQWLPTWSEPHVKYDPEKNREEPLPWFLLFSLPVSVLMPLCGIQPRTVEGGLSRDRDTGIQRKHDPARSRKIREYVQFGYPWSDLSYARRQSDTFSDLRKPGWLPTAIVLNILTSRQKRRGQQVRAEHLITVQSETEHSATLVVPAFTPGTSTLPPIEIIDGQHRLFAFRGWRDEELACFDIPVVAFYGLDISWQAYLFWTINITPKRINQSLAFDLYPLLRQEDWLERFYGHSVYRQARAQEITARLWSFPESPWYHRIDMLGDQGRRFVSQNAWVRALYATFIKSWEGAGIRRGLGGLFGAREGEDSTFLPWDLSLQSAFLIYAWTSLKDSIWAYREGWAEALRDGHLPLESEDPAFVGRATLLNTEQGVRGFLYVLNDLCFVKAGDLGLSTLMTPEVDVPPEKDQEQVDEDVLAEQVVTKEIELCVDAIEEHPAGKYVKRMAGQLATFDWCTSDAAHLSQSKKEERMAYRGSGGYALLRRRLLGHLADSNDPCVSSAACDVLQRLGWSD